MAGRAGEPAHADDAICHCRSEASTRLHRNYSEEGAIPAAHKKAPLERGEAAFSCVYANARQRLPIPRTAGAHSGASSGTKRATPRIAEEIIS